MAKPLTGKKLKCIHCLKECYVPKNRLETFKYCSRSCGAKHVRVKVKSNCYICSKQFEHISSRANKAKYCSRKCYHKAQSKKGRTQFECLHCHKIFNAPKSTNRKYCSKVCVNKSSKKTFTPVYSTVRSYMKRRGEIKECERCGYNKIINILGVHHRDRNRHNNKMENLEVLCPNCHSEEHAKHICHGFSE